MMKKQKGITLIALIITIIILIILATVSINSVIGEGGIIAQAQLAAEMQANSTAAEEEAMNELLLEYESIIEGSGESSTDDEEYTDTTLPTTPEVTDAMTRVVYNEETGYWEEADASDEWYDYSSDSKQWANVVLSAEEDGTIWTTDDDGNTVLDESSDYVQLVWIPRYAYKITSGYHTSTTGTIEIVFIDENNEDTSGNTYSTTYPSVTDEAMDDYVVHPAFDYGDTHLTGFWVGKFESSNTDCDSYYNSDGSVNEDFSSSTGAVSYTGTETMTVKPNVTSWRYISNSNIFDYCLALDDDGNVYGLSGTDTHMMKNTEWGAVAYLSQSEYGKNSEVYINNSSYYITGNAGSTVSASSATGVTNAYDTEAGQEASTTGNITGVYDMSGGAYERTAAYVDVGSSSSYFTSTSYGYSVYQAGQSSDTLKYVNVYEADGDGSTRTSNYALSLPSSGYYGDAVYETSSAGSGTYSWNTDYSSFPYSSHPFVYRGGSCSDTSYAGVFYFRSNNGYAYTGGGFRVVVPVL